MRLADPFHYWVGHKTNDYSVFCYDSHCLVVASVCSKPSSLVANKQATHSTIAGMSSACTEKVQ
jgi:hypothetical protein